MKNRPVRKKLPIICCLVSGLFASQVLGDWSDKEPYGGYNPSYGDFPPLDIDQKLSSIDDNGEVVEVNTPRANTAAKANNNQPVTRQPATNPAQNAAAQSYAAQGYAAQGYAAQPQQQPYANYYQNPNYNQTGYQQPGYAQPGMQRYNRGPGFSGPWNNRGSGFNGPWNNSRSGFSGPWNNRGSGFSGPWNNNRSSFSPFGNGGGWGW